MPAIDGMIVIAATGIANDFKYTFKPAYDFELRAVQDGVFHHDDPADQRRQAE